MRGLLFMGGWIPVYWGDQFVKRIVGSCVVRFVERNSVSSALTKGCVKAASTPLSSENEVSLEGLSCRCGCPNARIIFADPLGHYARATGVLCPRRGPLIVSGLSRYGFNR